MVEVVEGITARLGARWLVHFCSGERARRWRRSVRNGGRLRLGAARGEGEGEANGAGECVGQARGVLKSRPAAPGCPWCVAVQAEVRRWVAHMRRLLSDGGQSL